MASRCTLPAASGVAGESIGGALIDRGAVRSWNPVAPVPPTSEPAGSAGRQDSVNSRGGLKKSLVEIESLGADFRAAAARNIQSATHSWADYDTPFDSCQTNVTAGLALDATCGGRLDQPLDKIVIIQTRDR